VTYDDREARQELLDTVGDAIDHIAAALSALGEAYEQLDEASGDALEAGMFRPVQAASGRAQRTHTGFAERHGLAVRTFAAAPPPPASRDPRAHLDRALDEVANADETLSELQDSLAPVEVGDPELRAGLAEVRRALGEAATSGRRLERVLGR